MIDLELPLKRRTGWYRFFEMLPAILSYGSLALLIILSLVSPLAAAVYLLLIIMTVLIKAIGTAVHTIGGRDRLNRAQEINWRERLAELEHPVDSYSRLGESRSNGFGFSAHKENLRLMAADPAAFPKPSQLYNAVIIAAYNETSEVIDPTIQAVADTDYDNSQLIIVLAYEQRGGEAMKRTAEGLQKKYAGTFKAFHIVEHPDGLRDEVIGKGANLVYAAHHLKKWVDEQKIAYRDVIITTLDSDNRPHKRYFDYVTYEYIVHDDRKHLAYQPVALFLNNIWDVPAPMRVVATGNSFWNIISAMRPHTLRNFASHSQPMDALVEMDFWSKRSIVEDGHQYWRSYFYFGGNYSVIPIYVPIYQDAVLSDTYAKTLKAQFIQLRRWAYGASDIPFVATRIFSSKRNVPFWGGVARLIRLIDSHVTWASTALLVAVGGWVPLLINSEASRNIAAHQLPEVIGNVQRIAMIGLLITIFLSFKMLPPRPERYKKRRTLWMVLQWALMPIIAIVYSTASAFNAQTHLLLGKYLDKFDVTEKATHQSVARAKRAKGVRVSSSK